MRVLLASALLSVSSFVSACGAPSPDTARLGIQLDALAVSEVGLFQIAVVENAKSFDCGVPVQDCLADQVASFDLLPIRVRGGSEQTVLQIDATLTTSNDGGTGNQTVELEMPVGENYAVIIEALSGGNGFIGSSCTFVQDVFRTGTNFSAKRLVLDKDPALCSQADARVFP